LPGDYVEALAVRQLDLSVAERAAQRARPIMARAAIAATIACGVAFLVLQAGEYHERVQSLRPSTDAYGSIFYTITGIHGLHVLLGLCLLAYAALLPVLDDHRHSPYRALHNAALYWHFVDVVWVVIVGVLYLLPRI
jgi:heme/copper-type cytochrome/quinol oxidase subunit 3